MKSAEFNLNFKIHDLKNSIGVALSSLQFALVEHEGLEDNIDIITGIEALWLALESAREIAMHERAEEIGIPDVSTEFVVMPANEYFAGQINPFLATLRKIYPTVVINDAHKQTHDVKHIEINPSTFNQALGNIIGNAVNAGASIIDIHTVMRAYCLVVTIHDNGRGMSSEDIDKIMLSQFGDGLAHGVGTKCILITAAEHDFPLTYTSVEGQGTTIRVLIPYVSRPAPQ